MRPTPPVRSLARILSDYYDALVTYHGSAGLDPEQAHEHAFPAVKTLGYRLLKNAPRRICNDLRAHKLWRDGTT